MHSDLVRLYADPNNAWFIDGEVEEVFIETPLNEIFGVESNKTPDLIYLMFDGDPKIGEIKGNFNIPALLDAREQLKGYKNVMRRNMIPCDGFLVLGNEYVEVEGEIMYADSNRIFRKDILSHPCADCALRI